MIALYVAIGGAIGSVFRYFVLNKISFATGFGFPYGTMSVNVVGSLLMGLFIGYLAKTLPHSMEMRAFVATGILGGFTTFSAFSLDVLTLFEKGDYINTFFYVLFSVILSILAIFLGVYMVRSLA